MPTTAKHAAATKDRLALQKAIRAAESYVSAKEAKRLLSLADDYDIQARTLARSIATLQEQQVYVMVRAALLREKARNDDEADG
jgi:hypothetical protein